MPMILITGLPDEDARYLKDALDARIDLEKKHTVSSSILNVWEGVEVRILSDNAQVRDDGERINPLS